MMLSKKICLITLCLCVQTSLAATQFGSVLVSKVISVYDGDTFRVDIDSLSPIVGKNIATYMYRDTIFFFSMLTQ